MGLLVCLLSLAAIFFEGGFFQGLSLACLVGLLLFLKLDFFHWASSLLVVSSCHVFFVKVFFFQGLSLACLVGLLLFLKWDFFDWASSLPVVWLPVFLCSCFFFRACHWPAWSACCFSRSGISSVELPICLLSLAANFFREGVLFQGLSLACLVGLLLFTEWDFFSRASSLLVVSSCHFFRVRCFFSGPVTSLLGRVAAFREVGFFH